MNRAISLPKRILIICLVLLSSTGIDQLTKQLASQNLSSSMSTPYLNGIVRLEYYENSGIFSSIGVGLSDTTKFWLFAVGFTLALIALLIYLLAVQGLNKPFLLGGSMVIGGGFSNVLDRLTNDGAVIDFMFFVIGEVITDIFNLADLVITIGVAIMLIDYLGKLIRKIG